MKLGSAFVAVSCIVVASTAFSGEPRGIQTSSFPIDSSFYVPCLGEVVNFEGTIHVRSHAFETTSGVVHIVDNWTYEYLGSDQRGREWFAIGGSPYQANIRLEKGLVEHYRARSHWKPITEETPSFFVDTGGFRMTVNANGELVVFFEGTDDMTEAAKCVGPNN